MTKRNKIVVILALAVVMIMSLFAFTACGDNTNNSASDDNTAKPGAYDVTFMARENGNGNWKEVAKVKSNDQGVVVLPEEPAVSGYSFRGWFLEEACENAFDETKVTKDVTVYAFLSDKVLTVSIKKSADNTEVLNEQTVAGLTEIETAQKAEAEKANLTFDGFYTNEACTTKYTAESGVTTVYARYVAVVNFVDGYSNIEYTQKVVPGNKMEAIDEEKVKASYMGSIYGYTVLNENGKPAEKDENGAAKKFDLNTNITANTTLGVMWASTGLEYAQVGSSLVMTGVGQDKKYESLLKNAKVIRIPEYAQLNGEGDFLPVESISWAQVLSESAPMVEKFIFADGIKTISGVHSLPSMMGVESTVKEIVFPDTLKILDTALWNLSNLTAINLPEGLEIIIDSLWGANLGTMFSHNDLVAYGTESLDLPIAINVPASVKHLSMVPGNFKFAENSPFFYEGDSLYKKGAENNYETLVYTKNVGEKFEVKEGVKYVQVGAFHKCTSATKKVDIIFPSTFEKVAYNPNAVDYPYYVGGVNDGGTQSGSPSYGEYRLLNDKTTAKGRAIVLGLDALNKVVFNTTGVPVDFAENAIQGKGKNYTHKDFVAQDKVVFVGKIADGKNVKVTLRAYYKGKLVNSVEVADVLSNDTLITKEMIATALALNNNPDYMITTIKQFDKDFFATEEEATAGKKVNCNQYINVVYVDNAAGAKLEEVKGVMTVTGFEEATAKFDDQKGGYVVSIPEVFNGKPVEVIANNAFKNNGEIVAVNIPASIKTIGDNAFMKCTKLGEINFATDSKLSVIGAHAFEDTVITKIAVPLRNITEIKPYAFRIATLEQFINVKGEEDLILKVDFMGKIEYTPILDKYVLMTNGQSDQYHTIYKLNGVKVLGKTPADDPYFPNMNITEFNVDLVAIAGGMKYGQYVIGINVYNLVMFETNVLEGSVYYLDEMCKDSRGSYGLIVTKHMKKVSENAFTRMSDNLFVVKDAEGKPTKQTNFRIAVGYGFEHEKAPALTMETMKAFFKGKPFQNADGTLVKWLEGKVFEDADIEKLNPDAISYHYSNIS